MKPVQITTQDGFELEGRLFEPRDSPRAQVVIHPATATPQRYYQAFAEHLAARGFRVLTYDYRGIGASRRGELRELAANMTTWAEQDAVAALHFSAAHDRSVPLFVVGHSFGGQIAFAVPGRPRIDGALMVGAQSGYWKGFDWPRRGGMWLLWNLFVPAFTSAWGYLPGWTGIGEDLPAGVARQWARWCLSSEYFLEEHPEYGERMRRFTGPVLALSFSDDDYVPLRNAKWLLDHLSAADIEHRHIAPRALGFDAIGHFGFFRRQNADLWKIADDYLDELLGDGWRPASVDVGVPLGLRDADLMADLAYGRA